MKEQKLSAYVRQTMYISEGKITVQCGGAFNSHLHLRFDGCKYFLKPLLQFCVVFSKVAYPMCKMILWTTIFPFEM